MMMLNALSHISDDYIFRTLQDMKNEGVSRKEQLQFIKEQCRHYGMAGPNLPRLRGSNKGIEIEFEKSQGFPEDKTIKVSWEKLLAFAETQGYVKPPLGLKPVEFKVKTSKELQMEQQEKIRSEALQRFVERGGTIDRFVTEGRIEDYLTVPEEDRAAKLKAELLAAQSRLIEDIEKVEEE